jgi:origin recognition complex subunit 2
VLFSAASKAADSDEEEEIEESANEDDAREATPIANRNDRSARKRSQRMLFDQADSGLLSDGSDDGQDEALAIAILGGEDPEGDNILVNAAAAETSPTAAKTGKARGRPKGRRKEKSPSPVPADLPPHELYFYQNKTGTNKTSSNTLSAGLLLNHDDYFAQMNDYQDPHATDIERLKRLHRRAFDQWVFELEEGFNLCFYGYGSKRNITMEFAEHLYHQTAAAAAEEEEELPPKILVANAYTPGFTVRDLLTSLAALALPKTTTTKLPSQPGPLLDLLLASLPPHPKLHIILHSLDHPSLRKGPSAQTLLARLAAHPSISLIATCDTLNFPLMWDVTLSKQFHFLHHDTTTFEAYKAELDVVDDVNLLLGRSGRRLGGKDGVGYVLKSLPENARSLFRILVAEQLALADDGGENGVGFGGFGGGEDGDEDSDVEGLLGVEDEDEAAEEQQTPSRRGRGRPPAKKKIAKRKPVARQVSASSGNVGIEYRTLYHKAVEEFVCSSEVNFRTLLKEFHDHQMIESRKDALGTERLFVPFRREELEGILEELV